MASNTRILIVPGPPAPARTLSERCCCFPVKVGAVIFGILDCLSIISVCVAAVYVVPVFVSVVESSKIVDQLVAKSKSSGEQSEKLKENYDRNTILFGLTLVVNLLWCLAVTAAVILLFVGIAKRNDKCLKPYRFMLLVRTGFHSVLTVVLASSWVWGEAMKEWFANIVMRPWAVVLQAMFYQAADDGKMGGLGSLAMQLNTVAGFAVPMPEEDHERHERFMSAIPQLCSVLAVGTLIAALFDYWFYSTVTNCASTFKKTDDSERSNGFKYSRF